MRLYTSKLLFLSLLALFLLGTPPLAQAHADGRINIRAIHLEYHPLGMTAYYRLSLPLIAAALVTNGMEREASPDGSPYVVSRIESGLTFHYADPAGLAAGLGELGTLVASGHKLTASNRYITPEVRAAAVHARGSVPPFSTLAQAKVSVLQSTPPASFYDVEIGDVLVDVAILYRSVGSDDEIEIQSTLDPAPLSDAPVKNVVVSHAGGESTTYSLIGLLDRPMTVNPSIWTAVRQSLAGGTAHILQGADHLLFVACLALGAATLRSVAARITAFTAGHAMSMTVAYFGLIPEGDWFSGAIELAIALTVLGAAIALLANRMRSFHAPLIALAFGIIHGLGFAFGIRDLVSNMGSNVVISFLSFSLGGEAVQIVFGTCIWALSQRFSCSAPQWQEDVHAVLAACLTLAAGYWVLERSVQLWEMMPVYL